MGQTTNDSGVVLAVGLYALHDKKFFEDLINDPEGALDELQRRGTLTVLGSDRKQVVRLIEEAKKEWKEPPLDEWERYKRTGIWSGGWQSSWT
jgi:hypothetical protein